MSGRVLLSPSAIRVSKPGREVTTASLRDLLLDISARNGQILEHGLVTMINESQYAGYGPWSGTAAIGPYSITPDVMCGFVFAGNKQLNPPIMRVNSGMGFRRYDVSQMTVTGNSLTIKVSGQGVAIDGIVPTDLIAMNYVVFRRPQTTV